MFKKIEFKDFNENVFTLFKKETALLTAGGLGNHNTMTIGWGTLGVLWRKEIAIVYVKPTRYTYEFMNRSNLFTISWYNDTDEMRKNLTFCGTMSGRDVNKDEVCKLTPIELDGGVTYNEARLVIVCESIYNDRFEEQHFMDKELLGIYPNLKFHQRYIGKIIGIYKKEEEE